MDWDSLVSEEWKSLDIHSGYDYPSGALSNFAPHPFIIDGVSALQWRAFCKP